MQTGTALSRPLRFRLSSSRPPRPWRPCRAVARDGAMRHPGLGSSADQNQCLSEGWERIRIARDGQPQPGRNSPREHLARQETYCYRAGMLTTPYAVELAGEMNRYLSSRFGWTTTLFQHSTPDLLQELLVAGSQVANGVLSSRSFDELNIQVKRQFFRDPGLGDTTARTVLGAALPKNSDEFSDTSHKHRAVKSAMPDIRKAYLNNWKAELSNPGYSSATFPGSLMSAAEVGAYLTAFLLGLGMNSDHLVKWLDYRTTFAKSPISLAQLLDQFIDMYNNSYRPLEVMIVADRTAAPSARPTDGWLTAKQVREWLISNKFTPPRTIHGGIPYTSDQWGIYGALQAVGGTVRRLGRRSNLRSGKSLSFYPTAWIKGMRTPQKIPDNTPIYTLLPGYQLETPSLTSPPSSNRLEVAVEFVEAAATVEGPSAAGMLWASLETLLAAPRDTTKMDVVRRGADIGLIAFIRSEISNSLDVLLERCGDEPLGMALVSTPWHDRLSRLEVALKTAEYESLKRAGPRIHLRHAARLLDQPYIKEMRTTFQHILAGLYRQRNLVLHGGITDGPLIDSYLRCGYPLSSAIVNRYAKANETAHIDPQVFAFRASASIEEHLLRGSSVFTFLDRRAA
jgi:hypothetical protein